jgi:hypothetical protein
MFKRLIPAALSLLSLVTFAAAPARAASIYTFFAANYNVTVGSTVAVPVYLNISGTDFLNLVADNGLGSAGVRLTLDTGSAPADPATIASAGDVSPNTVDFDPFSVIDYVSTANAGFAVFAPSPGLEMTTGELPGDFLLGTITFTAGLTPGVTTFLASDLFATPDTTSWDLNYIFDPDTTASVTITTVAAVPSSVPLPTSAYAGLSLLLLLAATRAFNRRLA